MWLLVPLFSTAAAAAAAVPRLTRRRCAPVLVGAISFRAATAAAVAEPPAVELPEAPILLALAKLDEMNAPNAPATNALLHQLKIYLFFNDAFRSSVAIRRARATRCERDRLTPAYKRRKYIYISLASGVLLGVSFTDATLPRVGGNVPKSAALFRGNYVRPLPLVGNALRASVDAYEKTRRYSRVGKDEAAFYERAQSNIVADLDMLDLLRNSWLDALQDLEQELDDALQDPLTADPDAQRAGLDAARVAGHKYARAAGL